MSINVRFICNSYICFLNDYKKQILKAITINPFYWAHNV